MSRVNRLANGLARLGVRLGERIAVLLPNCHRYAELYLAAAQMGAVLVPLNVRLSPGELTGLIEHSEAVGIVPTMIHNLLACPDLERYDVSFLRTIFYGGACLSPDHLPSNGVENRLGREGK